MSVPLPPSPRDFEIHQLHLVHHMSTWRLAEKYEVSQTRIRQIVKAVSAWLTVTLPVKNEVEQERETRLAQHIAADQLQHQIELLQNYFDGSGDPKYLRQQTRAILSLARLGIIPGSIDALAADAQHQPEASARDPIPERSVAATDSPSTSAPKSAICNLKSEIPPPPPLGDFSPSTTSAPIERPTPASDGITTSLHAATSRQIELPDEDALEGLDVFEKRLLTLIDETAPNNRERLEDLNYSLANVRRQKAIIELRLAPNYLGATVTTNPPTNYPQPRTPSPEPLLAPR